MVKIQVDLLSRDELEYELTIRGLYVNTDAFDELRKKLRKALAKEQSENISLITEKYPIKFEQDKDELWAKVEEIENLVEAFKEDRQDLHLRKIRSKIDYIMRRADRAQTKSEEEELEMRKIKGEALLLTWEGSEEEKEVQINEDKRDSWKSDEARDYRPVNVRKWGLKFRGEHSGSVNAFIERAEELGEANGISKEQLFRAAVELLEDKALIWFRANRKKIGSWDKLVEELRLEFLPLDYDDRLWEEIRARSQGKDETIGVFVAVMEGMFGRLRQRSEMEVKLRMLKRNMAPFYQQQLMFQPIETIEELVRLGRLVETTKASMEAFIPPNNRPRRAMESDLAYVESPGIEKIRHYETAHGTALKCWKCTERGHLARDCQNPARCSSCGRQGVRRRNCERCLERKGSDDWRDGRDMPNTQIASKYTPDNNYARMRRNMHYKQGDGRDSEDKHSEAEWRNRCVSGKSEHIKPNVNDGPGNEVGAR